MPENQPAETATEQPAIEPSQYAKVVKIAKAVHKLAQAVEMSKSIDSSRKKHLCECFEYFAELIGEND